MPAMNPQSQALRASAPLRALRTAKVDRAADSASPRAPRAATVRKQEAILLEAERQFARFGLEGSSIEGIAAQLGISRQNLLYYYASKEALYVAVLDNVLADWIASMEELGSVDTPEQAIAQYIRAKLRFSRERPSGTSVFTREVMAGAPLYRDTLVAKVMPALKTDVKRLERWAREGLIRRTNFLHLMFVLWASTQAYADLAPQFALFEGKEALDEQDFEAAEKLLTEMVLRTLKP